MSYIKNLVNIKIFLPDKKYIIDIIKYCQLKHTENNWKIWHDVYGNKLIFDKNKNFSLKLNEKINLQTVLFTDLYSKAHIKKISSISKFSLISIKENIYYIWFLGKDNVLRLCMYVNDILIENQPILNSGMSNLKKIISFLDVDGFVEVSSIVEPLGSEIMKSWATQWPPSNDLLKMIPDIIKKDCNFV